MRERIAGVYQKNCLGRTDDVNQANGKDVLSFSDAVRQVLKEDRPIRKNVPDLTVDEATEEYLEAKKVHSSSADGLRERIAADSLIVPALGKRRPSDLTEPERHRLKYSLHGAS